MKLYIENLQKNYEKKRVLDIEKLQFDEGKIYAILGLNGSGKSTLLECISGLLEYDRGRIIYETGSHLERVKDRISIMTQFNYMFNNSVRENLELGLRFKKYDRKTIDERISKYINYFNFKGLLDKNAKRLSGGEGARTALIRTAVLESEITLLDEPTANMDFESTLIAEDIIRTMKANNRLAIVVTHDLYQAQRLADEVVFMDRGKIIEQGPGGEVFSNPQNALLRRILNKE